MTSTSCELGHVILMNIQVLVLLSIHQNLNASVGICFGTRLQALSCVGTIGLDCNGGLSILRIEYSQITPKP